MRGELNHALPCSSRPFCILNRLFRFQLCLLSRTVYPPHSPVKLRSAWEKEGIHINLIRSCGKVMLIINGELAEGLVARDRRGACSILHSVIITFRAAETSIGSR